MDYIKHNLFQFIGGDGSTSSSTSPPVNDGFYPRLIEPNIKYILSTTLQNCHNHRVRIYNIVFNLGIFIVFVFTFGITLYYCYKTKPTVQEKREKLIRDQNYILSKIRFYQNEKWKERTKEKTSEITNLPTMQYNPSI